MTSVRSQGELPSHILTSPGPGAGLAHCVSVWRLEKWQMPSSPRFSDFPYSAGSPAVPQGDWNKALPLCSLHLKRLTSFSVALLCSSANAAPEFEGRGGDDLGTEIANTLYRIFNKSSVDLKSLCISPQEHCWVLYVDVLVSVALPCRLETSCSLPSQCLFPLQWLLSASRVKLVGKR